MEENYKIIDADENYLMQHAEGFALLCVKAFAEHADRNVKMGPCYMTPEKWKTWAAGCIGQCLMIENEMVAFWLARPNYQTKEVEVKILAVDPSYKGRRLGHLLVESCTSKFRDMGMNVYNTDTSLNAPHVVKFHKSYGCKAVGMTSWPNTNYYTVILRMALRPEYEISDEEAERRFKRSAFKCKLMLNEDGSRTVLGKIHHVLTAVIMRLKRIIKKS